MRILVTFAVPSEFASWRRMRDFRQESDRPLIYRTSDDHHIIDALITGVGVRDRGRMQELFSSGIDMCIVSGLAGGLKPQHRVGTILAAKGIKAVDGFKDSTSVRSDGALIETAAQCGARIVDFICTSNRVVGSSSEKQSLGEIADAVDMESFHIMSEAERAGIPALAVRAVSDAVETNLPLDLNLLLDNSGQLRWPALFFELAKAPHRLPAFARFGANGHMAARCLAVFLDELTTSLVLQGNRSHDIDECRDLSRLGPSQDGNRARAGHI